MRSLLDLLVASLTAIHASRSHVHRRLPRDSKSRSIETVEANTYGLPEGESIAEELRRWFKRQRRVVLKAIPRSGMLPIHLPRLQDREWVDPMSAAMAPLLAPYWQETYRESRSRLSRGRARADAVINPHLRRQIERQSFNFCRSTNESTSRRLEDALDALKHEFVQGLVEKGETGPELARRVKAIFEGLTERHAATIAATEASRAIHAAQELAALESGVVAGKELLISADACELCQMVATEAKQVRLGQAFAVIGNHPEYSTIMHPPLHPNCRCSMIDVLFPEYGGPADVEWGLTLFQPQQEIEEGYEPPRGLKVPEPEPERIEEKPRPEFPSMKPEIPSVSFYGSISDKYQRDAELAIDKIPDKVKAALARHGSSFHIGHTLGDVVPDLAGKVPDGWPAGMTWDYAEGLYDRRTKKVVVSQTRLISPDRRVNTARFEGTILHETGHGYDEALEYASASQNFVRAYESDKQNIDPSARDKLEYFLQPGNRGREETFAELFSQELSKGTVYEALASHFPRTLELVRSLMK